MPDLIPGDNEPSMEDILSSIRKIIADDKSDEAELVLQPEPEPEPLQSSLEDTFEAESDIIADVLDTEELSVEDFMIPEAEEENSVSEPVDETNDDAEILELINLAEGAPDHDTILDEIVSEADFELSDDVSAIEVEATEDPVAFDETLDLVMDSDASNYLSTNLAKDPADIDTSASENSALRAELESEFSVEPFAPAETELETELEAILSETGDLTIESSAEPLEPESSAPDIEDLLADMMDETDAPAIDEENFATIDETPTRTVEPNEDEDMDLVKSLLADLMDDTPEDELEEGTASADLDEHENILDEILYSSVDDEQTLTDTSDESDLAKIAQAAREAAVATSADITPVSDDDKVELPERALKGRLALSTKASLNVGDVSANVEEDEGEEDAFWSAEIESNEDDTDNLEELLNELVEEEVELAVSEIAEEPTQLQEEDPMVRAVKKEALVDQDTEQESSDAFASLTTAVKEKEKAKDSGPPIGDLVQEALRPMLSEWLDKNLKGIVERAVTKEVKRISTGK